MKTLVNQATIACLFSLSFVGCSGTPADDSLPGDSVSTGVDNPDNGATDAPDTAVDTGDTSEDVVDDPDNGVTDSPGFSISIKKRGFEQSLFLFFYSGITIISPE